MGEFIRKIKEAQEEAINIKDYIKLLELELNYKYYLLSLKRDNSIKEENIKNTVVKGFHLEESCNDKTNYFVNQYIETLLKDKEITVTDHYQEEDSAAFIADQIKKVLEKLDYKYKYTNNNDGVDIKISLI